MGKVLMMRKGETHTAPLSGILASDIAVGSSVYLMENGSPVEYLVVNQGIPSNSSLYDNSCDGLWLLRKNVHSNQVWDSASNDLVNSDIHAWLNGSFFNLFGSIEQGTIKQVKLPHFNGTGSSGSVASGSNGLTANVFLLSGYELGWTTSDESKLPVDGACLNYFSGLPRIDNKRIGYLNGTAVDWWLRSPYVGQTISTWYVYTNGNCSKQNCTFSRGVRPALVLPTTALFDEETMILKGVK